MRAPWPFIVAAVFAVPTIVGIFWSTGYIDAHQSVGMTSVNVSSPLAPSVWSTHAGTLWRFEYDPSWVILEGEVTRVNPIAATKTFFSVSEDDRSFGAVNAAFATEGAHSSADTVVFAGYEAMKYSFGSTREDYVINYRDKVVILSTEAPVNDKVRIMLATFRLK